MSAGPISSRTILSLGFLSPVTERGSNDSTIRSTRDDARRRGKGAPCADATPASAGGKSAAADRAYSVDQIEADHPGLKGRVRTWIKRADAGDPGFAWLKFCIIRVERSMFIDEVRFRDSLHQRTAIPAAPSRRTEVVSDAEAT